MSIVTRSPLFSIHRAIFGTLAFFVAILGTIAALLMVAGLLSTPTFWTFVREFSPTGLRAGRDEEVTCADRGRCSSRTVFEEARTHTGLHIIEARRRFL